MQRAAMNIGKRRGVVGASMFRAARSLAALLAAGAGLALTAPAHGDTIYVSPAVGGKTGSTPEDAVGTITTAISIAKDTPGMDTIIVGPGSYAENINLEEMGDGIVFIADTMASYFQSVPEYGSYDMKIAPAGEHSVALTGAIAMSGSTQVKFVGFKIVDPATIELSYGAGGSLTFEDCWILSNASYAIEYRAEGPLSLIRSRLKGVKYGISADGNFKTPTGSITLTNVEAEADYAPIFITSKSFGTLHVERSFLKALDPNHSVILLTSGELSVNSSVLLGGKSAVGSGHPQYISQVSMVHNTIYNCATVVEMDTLEKFVDGSMTMLLANNLVAYSGPLTNAECGKDPCSTLSLVNNVEWLSLTDPDTDGLVKKAQQFNDLLPGFINASGEDFRLTDQATDVLGEGDMSYKPLDFFGITRDANGSTDVGAFERRPTNQDVLLTPPPWWDDQYVAQEPELTTLAVYRPIPAETDRMHSSKGREQFDDMMLMAMGGAKYSPDINLPALRNPNMINIARPNYSPSSGKMLMFSSQGGWYAPGTTQAIVVEQGGRDAGSQLMFDLWIADAEPSPAVVTVRVNGIPIWRHTALAGSGTSAPPLTGWTLPAMPTQLVGNVYGDTTKNEVAYYGIRIPELYKHMSEQVSKGDLDLIEISVDNSGGWALDNITISTDQYAWDQGFHAPFRETTLDSGLGIYTESSRSTIFPRPLAIADIDKYGQLSVLQASSIDRAGDISKLGNENTILMRNLPGNPGAFEKYDSLPFSGTASIGIGFLDANNDGSLESAELNTMAPLATRVAQANTSVFADYVMGGNKTTLMIGDPRALGVGDMNADGWCDLVILGTGANALQLGMGGVDKSDQLWQGFELDTAILPQSSSDVGKGNYLSMADVNNDGVPDIFYPIGGGRLWESSYDPDTKSVGFAAVSRGITITTNDNIVGMAWGDYNNDGYIDLFVPNRTGSAQLWQNPGPKSLNFTNVAKSVGLEGAKGGGIAEGGASAAWGDYDNDGDLDLVLTTGMPGAPDAIRLFRNSGAPNYTFTRVYDFGADVTCEGGDVRWFDYDNDGFLDLVVSSDSDNYPTRLFRNQLRDNNNEPNINNFLKVRVIGRGASGINMAGIGARVELWDEKGTKLLARRDVGLSQGLGGMDSLWVHFGGTDWTQNYIVRVFGPGGYSFEKKVKPGSESTTLGKNTISNMVTLNERELRPLFNIRSYAEVAPDKEVLEIGTKGDEGGGKGKK